MGTEQKLEKGIEALNKEAREAMDRLADKREELQNQLAATELAEKRQREREEERRRTEAAEAERRALEESEARYQSLSEEEARSVDTELSAAAESIKKNLERRSVLMFEMAQELAPRDQDRANALSTARVFFARDWVREEFARWVR